MFKTERMDLILEILHKKKHATIDYLAKHVFASNVTIRRDLKKMEDLGLVIRSYGGVTLMDTENKYVPLIIREQDRSSLKNQIARQAVSIISEGSTIFLDGSSTVLCMVNYLRDEQNITVITNSLRVATRLCEKRIDVYCTGGKLVPEALVCVGPYSETMIESMTADLMFFSSQGLSADGKISDFSESETCQRRQMLQHARKRYFLCDSSKLGKSFLFTVCRTSDIDGVISDIDVSEWLESGSLPAQQAGGTANASSVIMPGS